MSRKNSVQFHHWCSCFMFAAVVYWQTFHSSFGFNYLFISIETEFFIKFFFCVLAFKTMKSNDVKKRKNRFIFHRPKLKKKWIQNWRDWWKKVEHWTYVRVYDIRFKWIIESMTPTTKVIVRFDWNFLGNAHFLCHDIQLTM